jgi:hypothetical protein
MKAVAAALGAGLAAWCSLGTIGVMDTAPVVSRVALLPPWWSLPLIVAAAFAAIRTLRLSAAELSPLFGSTVILLPWLPLPVPPAALLWTGPFTVGVWTLVAAGIVFARARDGRNALLTDGHRAPWLAAVLAAALYGASASWLSPVLPDGDAPHYLILAQSLIEDGDLQIENNHLRGDYLAYSLTAASPDYLRRGANGAIYSIHAPGLPLLIAPAMTAFGYPGVVAWLGILAALSTALVWHLGYRVTGSAPAAWFGWAACALTPPFFFQATQVFPDGLAATCLLIGTLPLTLGGSWPARRGGHESRFAEDARWLIAGASLAALPWLQTRLALLAVTAAALLCTRLRTARQAASFGVVPAISAAAWFGFFYVVYGTFDPTAPYGGYTQMTIGNLARGLPGLLFDQQFGLLPNAPVYAFVLSALLVGAVALRRSSLEMLALFSPYVLGVGMYQMWWGGMSVPGRFLTPLVLVLGVGAARTWHAGGTRATRLFGAGALAASLVITAVLLGPGRGRLLFNFRDGVALWLEWANASIDLPKAIPSVFRDDGTRLGLKTAAWVASFVAAWATLRIAYRSGAREDQGRSAALQGPAISGPGIWGLALAVMLGLTLAWEVDGARPLTPATSEAGLLRGAAPFRTTAYDFNARRFEESGALLSRARIAPAQRRPDPPPVLLAARDVPAGTYELRVPSNPTPGGVLVLRVGDTGLPFLTVSAPDAQSRPASFPVRLPTAVRSLRIEGDEAATRSISAVSLALVEWPAGRDFGERHAVARRAARYGPFEAFFLDDNAYPEPEGFWIAGGRAARMVVASQPGQLDLLLRNSPVENRVSLDLDGTVQEFTLQPGEERIVTLPARRREAVLRIRAERGFRPSAEQPGNADQRYLGCWVEAAR